MNSDCDNMKDHIADLVTGILSQAQARDVEQHLKDCPACRQYAQALRSEDAMLTGFVSGMDADMPTRQERILQAIDNSNQSGKTTSLSAWRIIMKSPITKLSTAAAIIVVVALSLTVVNQTATDLLAETLKASHSVRSLHIKNFLASQAEPIESWVEFHPNGTLKNMRFHKPAWVTPSDGESVIVWKDNIMQLWIKKKNLLSIVSDKEIAQQALTAIEQLDPKVSVESLEQELQQGNVEVDIDEPSNKAEPIIVTATSTEQLDESPLHRMVLSIDRATKLVNVMKLYSLKDGEYHLEVTVEYYEYNEPVDEQMFTLTDLPDDVIRMDQTAQEIGVPQGDLTNEETAIEVTRQFLEALIAKDYAEAGRIFGAVPAERIQKTYGSIRFIRIIEIGQPKKKLLTGEYRTPCKVEIERDGQTIIWEKDSYARPAHGQPNRWELTGGFIGF